ncbi:chromosomal replication initiator DnaA [Rhizobium leguminosarum]
MSTFSNGLLFSTHFGVSANALEKAGLIDTFLNVDTPLFVDPILLDKSSTKLIRVDAYEHFRKYISQIVRLLVISKREGDAPWKTAQKLLNLQEPPENGLGYGSGERAGSSRPDELRDTILRTTKEIVDLGVDDPEMISLMGFFEENVGPDTISDLTTRIIASELAAVTLAFCKRHKVPTRVSPLSPKSALPHYTAPSGKQKAVLLVPKDIIRELPLANDWSDVSAAANANREIRDRVNSFLAGIVTPTVTEKKAALKAAALFSADLFNAFIAAVKERATSYDPNDDVLGYYKLREILKADRSIFKLEMKFELEKGPQEVLGVVHQTLEMFKHHVEKGNLWEALWSNGKPKKERAAQLIYYAIADSFCMANDIDISPEANMGGGPIDFKFSKGYKARVLVEMKRSSGTVRHGYERQLEIYKDASRTNYGVFVIINYGDLGDKLKAIQDIRAKRLKEGLPASEIVVIDAMPKASASKRK